MNPYISEVTRALDGALRASSAASGRIVTFGGYAFHAAQAPAPAQPDANGAPAAPDGAAAAAADGDAIEEQIPTRLAVFHKRYLPIEQYFAETEKAVHMRDKDFAGRLETASLRQYNESTPHDAREAGHLCALCVFGAIDAVREIYDKFLERVETMHVAEACAQAAFEYASAMLVGTVDKTYLGVNVTDVPLYPSNVYEHAVKHARSDVVLSKDDAIMHDMIRRAMGSATYYVRGRSIVVDHNAAASYASLSRARDARRQPPAGGAQRERGNANVSGAQGSEIPGIAPQYARL